MTKYNDTRNPMELDSIAASGLRPLKDQGFFSRSAKGKIMLEETDQTYVYRRVCSQR